MTSEEGSHPHVEPEQWAVNQKESVGSLYHTLENLYKDVLPFSDGHKALIHYLQFQRSKHGFREAQRAVEKTKRADVNEKTLFQSILSGEQNEFLAQEVKVETLRTIIESERLTNEKYEVFSRTTQSISDKLERHYGKQKVQLPLAKVALDLSRINEYVLNKRK